ncbi:MAG TPA: hypothetical protein VLI43_05555, partial [Gemmatimonadaceae bacterium]|nr:hypothetical protein [Gemmatimonadaceae bacterium]
MPKPPFSMCRVACATVLACLVAAPAAAQRTGAGLTSTERALVKSIDAHNADALALLIKLVDINSGTMNFAGVRKVADVLAAQLDTLGFRT